MGRRRTRWRDLGRKRTPRGGRGWITGVTVLVALAWLAAVLGTAWRGQRVRAGGNLGAAREAEQADAAWEQEIAARWEAEWRDRMGPLAGTRSEDPAILRAETGSGVVVWFREEGIERQFRNLEGIWRHAEEEGRDLATVNLVPERNLPVTFR